MTDAPHKDHERFEYLKAGRALGDLTTDECKEWKQLLAKHGSDQAYGMDYAALVGTLEREFTASELMPGTVKYAVLEAATVSDTKTVTQGHRVQRFGGWALAACLAVVAGILFVQKNDLPNGKALLAEVQGQKDVVRVEFQGDAKYPAVTGKAYWSDHLQNGVIVMQGLPANEPLRSQYQLWIVDKNRDRYPVDGGVFNHAGRDGSTIISIDAKLRVDTPEAFVITEETPGGVVVSKQDRVVAVALVAQTKEG
jgi:hypothetical protein